MRRATAERWAGACLILSLAACGAESDDAGGGAGAGAGGAPTAGGAGVAGSAGAGAAGSAGAGAAGSTGAGGGGPTALAGRYTSACTPGPNGTYFTVDVTLTGGAWDLDYDLFADAECRAWTVNVAVAGAYELTGPSAAVAGAYEARFGFSSKAVTARDASAVATLNGGGCAAAAPWQVGVPQDVGGGGCAPLGQAPLAECGADYDLVARDAAGVLRFGARPADNRLCTPDARPAALSALALRPNARPFSTTLGSVRPEANPTDDAFLENVFVVDDGSVYATSLYDQTIYRYTEAGGFVPFAPNLARRPVGVAADEDGSLYFTALSLGSPSGRPSVWRIAPGATTASQVAEAPGPGLLNGIQRLAPGVFVITDSRGGLIWRFIAADGALTPWSTDPALALPPNPPMGALGPNGLKVVGDVVYASNAFARTLVRIPVLNDGSAGPAESLDVGVGIDDFAVRSDGTIFATSHAEALYRITPDLTVETFAGEADGVLGCTAAEFGRTASDWDQLYVVTDGGDLRETREGIPGGPALLVRLDVRGRE